MGRVFTNGWETWVQSQVESYQRLKKCYSIPPYLTHSNIRYVSKVKWSNPGKGVTLFPTPRCSSYWKESLRVTLDYGCQLTYLHTYCHSWIHSVSISSFLFGYTSIKLLLELSLGFLPVWNLMFYECWYHNSRNTMYEVDCIKGNISVNLEVFFWFENKVLAIRNKVLFIKEFAESMWVLFLHSEKLIN